MPETAHTCLINYEYGIPAELICTCGKRVATRFLGASLVTSEDEGSGTDD